MHVVSRCADNTTVDTVDEPRFRSVIGQGKVPSPSTHLWSIR